jgi:hypothetical protein
MARAKLDPAHVQVQLKVTLLGSRPPIWRRLLVPADLKLPRLHAVLQLAFGWTDSHLHAFRLAEESYEASPPQGWADAIFGSGRERQDEKRFRLCDLLHAQDEWLIYEYDFGDSWEHEVLVEKMIPGPPIRQAVCLAGKRAGPPEDCGGIPGYYHLLGAIADPKHPEHQELLEWLGDAYDPAAFDKEALNRLLAGLKI